MKASGLSFRAAVIFAMLGMTWGIVMAISEDHAAMPAHAHLNLLGWVSLFLFGLFYRLHPALEASRLALAQVALWIAATAILTTGVGLITAGQHAGDPIAGVGAFLALADMALFAALVFGRHADAASAAISPAVAAE
jgi:hypothetical protein